MKGYWVILGSAVKDTEAQKKYGALWAPIAERYQAKLITSGSSLDLKEGSDIARVLMVEFPSVAAAKACYDDPEYRDAMKLALAASERNLLILEGDIV